MVEPPCMLQNAPQRGFHLQPRHVSLGYATFALKDDALVDLFQTVSCSKVEHKYSDEPSQTVEQANKCLKEPPTFCLTPTFKSVQISFWAIITTYTFCKPQPPNFLLSMAPGQNHHKFGGSRTSEDRWNLWIVAG